jgi:hypothetical protein
VATSRSQQSHIRKHSYGYVVRDVLTHANADRQPHGDLKQMTNGTQDKWYTRHWYTDHIGTHVTISGTDH